MSSLQKECELCYRCAVCYIDRSYKEFKTGEIILCPCIECIVKPICKKVLCPYIRTYHRNQHQNTLQSILEMKPIINLKEFDNIIESMKSTKRNIDHVLF